jgi:hypothetical protein
VHYHPKRGKQYKKVNIAVNGPAQLEAEKGVTEKARFLCLLLQMEE